MQPNPATPATSGLPFSCRAGHRSYLGPWLAFDARAVLAKLNGGA